MKLIVGLGNPGKEYNNTRHNIGFMLLNYFPGNNLWSEKFEANYREEVINGEKVMFIMPLTFMNLSGIAVRKYVDYYKIDIDDVLIIQDDLDLPVGSYRIKYDSSSGGHNGIKSIIDALGTSKVPRLKIGISNDKNKDTKDYVLGKFSKEEIDIISKNKDLYKDIIINFIDKGIDDTIARYNKKGI